ncbi:A/G-specific adenine glycosylase, partial [Thermococcus sp. M36]|nr:A/G-specific adenine glycosylase [Thermococcus sp. M36]
YYNRCKNLLFTARKIVQDYKGKFPEDYDTIVALKGIGPYTAAAIASFAFNLPYAVIDGNVFRVLSRFFGIDTAIDSNNGKKEFTELANKALDKQNAGLYNQAIMDFGATVCKPLKPLCSYCVMRQNCIAFNSGRVNEIG